MKKILLLTILITSSQVNYFAQDCVDTNVMSLSDCLLNQNITNFQLVNGANNTLFLYAKANANPGLIQSCIAQYNADSNTCPDAPRVVYSLKPDVQMGQGSSANWAVGG